MPTIYFSNFRGFGNTFLNLKDINFFLGENSTGKTSILKLIGIFASQNFWRDGEFGKDEISFDGFENTVTHNSKNYFEIGVYEDSTEIPSILNAFKFKYIEKEKHSYLKEISYKNNTINLQVVIEGNLIKYRYRFTHSNSSTKEKDIINWYKDSSLNEQYFERTELQYFGILPILSQLLTLISFENSGSELMNKNLEIKLPSFANNLAWIAPVRAEPINQYRDLGITYQSKGQHTPFVLRKIIKNEKTKHIFNKFGSDSGLFENIDTIDLIDIKSFGVIKDKKMLEQLRKQIGYSDAFEIRITINGESRNITDVGYGVSQILPILTEALWRPTNSWFATQQPEVHLHPKAQAALGDFIYRTNFDDKQKFLIETHSEYLVNRYRLRLSRVFRETNTNLVAGQVVFFYKTIKGNKLTVLQFNSDGSYPDEQPKEFRDFFLKEQLKLITI